MKGNTPATILLILAGMVLLMFGFSGRYKNILTAAFPSLGRGSSGSGNNPTNATPRESVPIPAGTHGRSSSTNDPNNYTTDPGETPVLPQGEITPSANPTNVPGTGVVQYLDGTAYFA